MVCVLLLLLQYKYYNFAAGQYSSGTGHFTQVVWKGTTKLGCAYAASCRLYVCEYSEQRGNIMGYFTQNVFPAAS
jgi:hypothetical protein